MAITGERFEVDLTDDHDTPESFDPLASNQLLIKDIKERDIATNTQPPAPPTIRDQSNGFPAHRDRTKRSKFKRQQNKTGLDTNDTSAQATKASTEQASTAHDATSNGASREPFDSSIDRENKERLAKMSDEEIEAARQELMSGLSSSLIEKLLRKANIEEDEIPSADSFDGLDPPSSSPSQPKKSSKKVTFKETPSTATNDLPPPLPPLTHDPEAPPTHTPSTLFPATTTRPPPLPTPPAPTNNLPPPPPLSPNSPDFLPTLHSTYYPSLPPNPSTLTWLTPPTPAESAAYSSLTPSLPASTLRFDFRGRLLPPRLSAQIPVTKGLHHHGLAPESAGYTIPELSILARSTNPSQRCIAFQTVGRVLFRLGRGDFGAEGGEEEEGGGLWEGLWGEIEKGKVVEGMVEAAAREEGGNRSVWCTAVEACWLWRKGGGKKTRGR